MAGGKANPSSLPSQNQRMLIFGIKKQLNKILSLIKTESLEIP